MTDTILSMEVYHKDFCVSVPSLPHPAHDRTPRRAQYTRLISTFKVTSFSGTVPALGSDKHHPSFPGYRYYMLAVNYFICRKRTDKRREVNSGALTGTAGSESQGWDKPTTQHWPFQRHSCMVFFNLDVLFCFCIHILAQLQKIPVLSTRSLARSPSLCLSILWSLPLQTRPQCPRLQAVKDAHMWMCNIRGTSKTVKGNRGCHWREGDECMDGRQGDDQRWIKGVMESQCTCFMTFIRYAPWRPLNSRNCFNHHAFSLSGQVIYPLPNTATLKGKATESPCLKRPRWPVSSNVENDSLLPEGTWRLTRSTKAICFPN